MKGNSAIFVQTFACLEGPVCENYDNEKITIANPNYPIQQTIQQLVDDRMYSLVIEACEFGSVKICECYIFTPTPMLNAGLIRPLVAVKHSTIITESLAFGVDMEDIEEGSPDELTEGDNGRPPEVPIGVNVDLFTVQLVHADNNASTIVGFQIIVANSVVSAKRLYEPLKLGRFGAADVDIKCLQLSGHLANDNKQINILTGQGSCSVMYPMPCCLVHKDNLGQAPVWIQRRYIRALFSAPQEADDRIIDLLAAYLGKPIIADAQKRVGEFCIEKSHAKWHQLSAGGRLKMTPADRARANKMSGSSFHSPLFTFQACKQNAGFMHTPSGHITHFWIAVSDAIRTKMQKCEWRKRLDTIVDEVTTLIKQMELEVKTVDAMSVCNDTRKRITSIRNRLTRCEKKAVNEVDPTKKETLLVQAAKLRIEELEACNEMVTHAEETELGDYYQLIGGLKEFEEVLKGVDSKESKRAQSSLEYALWKCVESRAGGKLDPKNSGMEQTNGKGMISLQNCIKVTHALREMYPDKECDIRMWLNDETKKWEALAKAIFEAGCFLKSQKKRSPAICDDKLFVLWYCWEDAFPGKKFNKFHGMFCTIREFVHQYEMTGRVSEESNESFNATLAEIKDRVKSMTSAKQRIEITNARTQGNLKEDILDDKISLQKSITGKKRGKQKPRVRALDGGAVVETMRSMHVIFKGQEYCKLTNGNLIPKKWQDIYEWFASGIAPSQWREALNRTAPRAHSATEKAREGFSKF